MSKAIITEGGSIGKFGAQVLMPDSDQAVTFTTSTTSAAFGAKTNLIRVIADADVYLAFGAAPTATANSLRVPANSAEYFAVRPTEKVACYDGIQLSKSVQEVIDEVLFEIKNSMGDYFPCPCQPRSRVGA